MALVDPVLCFLRLALLLALSGSTDTVLFTIAVVCSTWSAVNLATSKRDILTPYGDVSLPGVRSANRMVARTDLIDFQNVFLNGWIVGFGPIVFEIKP